ncbi:MAG: hypothetical protein ACI9VS_001639 [Candidatus Binatia bacterium]
MAQQQQETVMGFDLTGTIIFFIACVIVTAGYFAVTKMLDATDDGDGML